VAQFLDVPQVTYVRRLALESGVATAERMMEDGYDVIRVPLPAVFTVVKEINEPRLPSLKGKMKAKKAEITIWGQEDLEVDAAELGLDGSPTRVVEIFAPEPRGGGVVFDGDVDESVGRLVPELVAFLKNEG
jgi:electron transfer flavoprotein beta subunit